MLKVMVRHPETKLYMQWDGKWTGVADDGIVFEDETAAVRWCILADLTEYEVVKTDLKNPQTDYVLIQQRSRRPSS